LKEFCPEITNLTDATEWTRPNMCFRRKRNCFQQQQDPRELCAPITKNGALFYARVICFCNTHEIKVQKGQSVDVFLQHPTPQYLPVSPVPSWGLDIKHIYRWKCTVDYAATQKSEHETITRTKEIQGTLDGAVLSNSGIDVLPINMSASRLLSFKMAYMGWCLQ